MSERIILINYHEIGLNGRNRGRFERTLQGNLAAALGDLAPSHATVSQVEAGEAGLDVERMVNDALALVTYEDYPCPSYRPSAWWPVTGEARP